ncbi:hypothetical protein LLH23_21775 [bacterium]|nr:hypothetical protein [bacterium]
MPKPVDEPITMLEVPLRSGARFVWRGCEHHVSSLGGRWARRGRWWLGESYKRYFRITTLEHMALDLCYDELAQAWTVGALMD